MAALFFFLIYFSVGGKLQYCVGFCHTTTHISHIYTYITFLLNVSLLRSFNGPDFSRGRAGGLVFPSLSEFSTVHCDSHSQRLWHSQYSRNRCFSGTLLPFRWSNDDGNLMFPLPFLNPAWTCGRSLFAYCWSLSRRTLSITLLVCEMSATVW